MARLDKPIEIKLVDSPMVRQHIADQSKVIAEQHAEIKKLQDVIHRLCGELHQHNRVTARLLDGWLDEMDEGAPYWESVGIIEPMSDGEAAIIRQHQKGVS